MIPVGFAEVTAKISVTGDPKLKNCVFGVELEGSVSQTLVNAVSTSTGDFLRDVMTNDATFVGIDFLEGDSGGSIAWTSTSGNGAGSFGNASMPKNTALLFKKGTGAGGRRNRGRIYVPQVNNAEVFESGLISASYTSVANTSAATFLIELDTAGAPMTLLHSEPPFTPTKVSSLVVDPMIATQRRRLR